MHFTSFSIAAHSTWNHCPEYDFLIDAGDGVSSFLGIGTVNSLKTVLLTHAHMDHVGGLAALIHLRKRTPKLEPLKIIYTDPCWRTELISKLADGAHWQFVQPGDKIPLAHVIPMRRGEGRKQDTTPRPAGEVFLWAVPFAVDHKIGQGNQAVGYKIFQRRKGLNPKYQGYTSNELRDLSESGVKDINIPQPVHILTYTGDTKPLSADLLGSPRWLMHDATYPMEGMQEDHDHSLAVNAVDAAEQIKAGLIVNHLSIRYKEVAGSNSWHMIYKLFPDGTQIVAPVPKPHLIHLD